MKKTKQYRFWAVLAALALVASLAILWQKHTPSRKITGDQFAALLSGNQIVQATVVPSIYPGIFHVQGSAKMEKETGRFYVTTHLEEAALKKMAASRNIAIQVPGQGGKAQWANVAVVLLIAGLAGWVVYHQTSVGKMRGSQKVRTRPRVRFDDVAGIAEAKEEVREVVDFLRHPKKYARLGCKLPKGILLVGPPGTGKTMLAKAIAGEANANFFSAHGSDFNEVFVGVGAKRVRELFRQAVKNTPAIIFIDEIDCLGKSRKFDTNGETQQTNNALLAAMDGFEGSEGVVVLAATNRPEDLDEALMRPGRFDRKVFVPYPDMKGREAILDTHAQGKPIRDKDLAINRIAQTTPGMSGADLANLVNEAALLCAQHEADEITLTELEAARDKVRFGKERKSMVVNAAEREIVAYHEAGHALINLQMDLLPPLYKVSIVPRGQALGTTTLLPNEDQHLSSRDFLWQELVVLMGGRAAEKAFYGMTSNGASGDLDTARKIARKMVLEWGMGERLYYQPERPDAEHEINRLLQNADRQALAIVEQNKKRMRLLASALLHRETLTRDEVLALFKQAGETPPEPADSRFFPV